MSEETHVEQARQALLKADGKLNAWEVDFCNSMLHITWPSTKQLSVLETLVAKAKSPAKRGKRPQARGRLF